MGVSEDNFMNSDFSRLIVIVYEKVKYEENEYSMITSYPLIKIEDNISVIVKEVKSLRGFALVIDTCNIKYNFPGSVFNDKLNSNMYQKGNFDFSKYVERGDRIVKNKGSDTLWLHKFNNETLIFRLQKWN